MNTTTAPKIPTPAEIKAWPKYRTELHGFAPGATSHTWTNRYGKVVWIFGGILYDANSHTLSAYSMKDATDVERTSVSQALDACRRRWFGFDDETTAKEITKHINVPVPGRHGAYVAALGRVCMLGGPDDGMRPGAASEIGDAFGHLEQELDTDVEGPDGKRYESEFILNRVWSPEHGVQLAVRIEDRPTDGPGHSVAHLRVFHQRLGEEIERLLQDHPEQATYGAGK